MLGVRGIGRDRISAVAIAEPGSPSLAGAPLVRVDHHLAHASTAYRLSAFDPATIVVCDPEPPHLTVWTGQGPAIGRVDRPWHGPGFTALMAQAATVLGMGGDAAGHVEALARLHPDARDARLERLWRWQGDDLFVDAAWPEEFRLAPPSGPVDAHDPPGARLAGALQNRIADLLVELLARLRAETGAVDLCLGGSLFYNAHIVSQVRSSGLFARTFVPVNPGSAGVAGGAALEACTATPRQASPFLGPAFSPEAIKATLDNCKLSYNGFSEPIVCAPRDAIRVFYGTGLDLLVLDRFVLTK